MMVAVQLLCILLSQVAQSILQSQATKKCDTDVVTIKFNDTYMYSRLEIKQEVD